MKNPGYKQIFLEKLVSCIDKSFFPSRLDRCPKGSRECQRSGKKFGLGFLGKGPLDLLIPTFH